MGGGTLGHLEAQPVQSGVRDRAPDALRGEPQGAVDLRPGRTPALRGEIVGLGQHLRGDQRGDGPDFRVGILAGEGAAAEIVGEEVALAGGIEVLDERERLVRQLAGAGDRDCRARGFGAEGERDLVREFRLDRVGQDLDAGLRTGGGGSVRRRQRGFVRGEGRGRPAGPLSGIDGLGLVSSQVRVVGIDEPDGEIVEADHEDEDCDGAQDEKPVPATLLIHGGRLLGGGRRD